MGEAKISTVNKVPWPRISRKEQLEFLLSSYQVTPSHSPLPSDLFTYLGLGPEEAAVRETIPPFWLWGLCEDFEECRNRLRNCETARKWIKNPEQTLSNENAQSKRPTYQLKKEAAGYFSAMARHVWEASIFKALAGVLKEETDPRKRGTRRLVIDAVVEIYRDSMLNLARRLRSKPVPIIDPQNFQFAGPKSDIAEIFSTAEDGEKKWIEILRRRQSGREEQKRLFQSAQEALRCAKPADIIEACGLLAAAAQTMTVPATIVAKLKQIAGARPYGREARAAAYTLRRMIVPEARLR